MFWSMVTYLAFLEYICPYLHPFKSHIIYLYKSIGKYTGSD